LPDLIAAGIRIHYVDAPSAPKEPALVLLHGAGANHSIWLGQMKALRERAWILIPDLPAHGRSAEIPGLTISEYANALAPFLEAMIERLPAGARRSVVLAGHSMGGAIAMTLAAERPELLSGLILVGSGAKLGVSPQILDGLRDSPAETQALIARWSFTPAADPRMIINTMRDLRGAPVERTLADFRACNAFDLRERAASIEAPTLILCGAEDRMTPPKFALALAETMPRATARVIEGAGHAVMLEAPDAVSSAMAEFLDGEFPRAGRA
jgi:pimeloyl-ACP methyl ester carboxylesterase